MFDVADDISRARIADEKRGSVEIIRKKTFGNGKAFLNVGERLRGRGVKRAGRENMSMAWRRQRHHRRQRSRHASRTLERDQAASIAAASCAAKTTAFNVVAVDNDSAWWQTTWTSAACAGGDIDGSVTVGGAVKSSSCAVACAACAPRATAASWQARQRVARYRLRSCSCIIRAAHKHLLRVSIWRVLIAASTCFAVSRMARCRGSRRRRRSDAIHGVPVLKAEAYHGRSYRRYAVPSFNSPPSTAMSGSTWRYRLCGLRRQHHLTCRIVAITLTLRSTSFRYLQRCRCASLCCWRSTLRAALCAPFRVFCGARASHFFRFVCCALRISHQRARFVSRRGVRGHQDAGGGIRLVSLKQHHM